MAKSKDPFAGVGLSAMAGLDQRLFGQQPSQTSPDVRPSGRKPVRPTERRKRRPAERTKEPTAGPPDKQPASIRATRPVVRRPYDFFEDQTRWLARRRLEIEEKHGVRVTANAMVQLAMDLLITDFERKREESQLMKRLVRDKQRGIPGEWDAVEADSLKETDG